MNINKIDIIEDNRIATAKRLVYTSIIISIFYHLIFTLYIDPPFYIIALNISLLLVYILPLKLLKNKKSDFGKFLSFLIGCSQLAFAAFFFGAEAGFQYLLIDKLVAINFIFGNTDKKSKNYKYLSNFFTLSFFIVSNLFFTQANAFVKITTTEALVLKISSIIFCSFIIFITTYIFFKDVTQLEERLFDEYNKNDVLLNSLLPQEIIEEWDNNHSARPHFYHKDASIMFVKIANLEDSTINLKSTEKFEFLNSTYIKFDEIVSKFSLIRIKIIGNSYMIASGIPNYSEKHLDNIILASFEIKKAFKEICQKTNLNLNLKIGIHTGELASGVVGQSKIFYDVWGETVNKTSRLCDVSKNGNIVVSKEIFDRNNSVCDKKDIGCVNVKGLGLINTYEIYEKNI